MLIKSSDCQEGLRHICDGKSEKYIKSKPPVYLHDVQASLLVGDKLINITFCPYCGQRVEDDKQAKIEIMTHDDGQVDIRDNERGRYCEILPDGQMVPIEYLDENGEA